LAANFLSVGLATNLIISNTFDERGGLRNDWIVTNPAPRISQIISSVSFRTAVNVEEAKLANDKESESPPVIVDLITKAGSTKQTGNTTPSFQVALNGSFANGKRIMNIHFNLPLKGEIAVLEGVSGIGKSTLLRTLTDLSSGFVSIQPKSVSLAGVDRLSFSPDEWRRRVLYITQDGATSIQGTAEFFLEAIALSPTPVIELIENWGMSKTKLAQPWSNLSGGEAQRVLLAIALVSEPAVLLLDEPTSAIDEDTKLLIEASLQIKSKTCSIILVTHDDNQKKRLGTMMLTMEQRPGQV